MIVDKMDSAKNHVPWFSNGRTPKDVEPLLKDVLKMHVTGVIIYGKPDKRYLFWSLPHLPGNTNLNLECIRRALTDCLGSLTFRPKLYIQFDNASDNKSYTSLCLCGWLVQHEYVSRVMGPFTTPPRIWKVSVLCCVSGGTVHDAARPYSRRY